MVNASGPIRLPQRVTSLRPALVSPRALVAVALCALAVGMLGCTWLRWCDPFIDFGDELYTAWRLAEGDVLYRDLWHLKGPLSPYVNALLFRLFGVGLMTLVVANLVVLTLITTLMYRLLRRTADRVASAMGCAVFLTVFAFGDFCTIANYNYVCPYSHEATHSMLLALVSLQTLIAFLRSRRMAWLAVTGLCLGLSALADAPVTLAGALAVASAVMLDARRRRMPAGQIVRVIALLVVTASIAPLFAACLLSRPLGWPEAWRGVGGQWWFLLHHKPYSRPYYQGMLGLDQFGANARTMLLWAAGYVAMFGWTCVLAFGMRRSSMRWRALGTLAALILAICVGEWLHWQNFARPLPLLLAGMGISVLVGARKSDAAGQRGDTKRLVQLTLIAFSLALLAKMLFNVGVAHNGFVLAMPGTLLVVVALIDWIPAWVDRKDGAAGPVRAVAVALVMFGMLMHVRAIAANQSLRIVPVGTGPDRFLSDGRAVLLQGALDVVARAPGRNLIALPGGAMVNYLTRRVSPSPLLRVGPYALLIWPEEQLLSFLEANPPDVVALVQRDDSEDGAKFFGRDYGYRLSAWVFGNYREIGLLGYPPFVNDNFGILLLRHADANE